MIQSLNNVEVITLFVESVRRVRGFYEEVFGLTVIFEDEVSAVFRIHGLMLNLLEISKAHTLVDPATVADQASGSRFMFTIAVDDADAACAELRAHGVALLNGPIDRPWGRRTAAFADPAGNVWEVAQVLPRP
jgi:catechol 2,3-dioxygenase-like lactoylglutathione lyase family enzyme